MSDWLADDLAAALLSEPLGLPCGELARRVRRRRGDVLAVLHTDPRFERSGRRRGSRWRLTTERPASTVWARMGTNLLPWLELDPSGLPVVGRRTETAA